MIRRKGGACCDRLGGEERDGGFEMMAIIVHTSNRQNDTSAPAPQVLGPSPREDDKRRRPTENQRRLGRESREEEEEGEVEQRKSVVRKQGKRMK